MVSVILLINGSVLISEIVCKRVSLIATSHLKRTYPVVSHRERFWGLFCFYYIQMTFRIALCIHNQECMLTTLVSPMQAYLQN